MATNPVLTIVSRDTIQGMNVKAARKMGNIPAVVYNKSMETREVYVDERELRSLIAEFGTNRKITLNMGGEKMFAIIKEIQKENMKNLFFHLDLQALDEKEKLKMTFNIHVLHRDEVERDDFILQVQTNEVDLQMYPRHMPEHVEVDASLLKEKDNITFADLNIAGDENIEILDDLETVVATLVYVQQAEEEPAEAEEEEMDAAAVPTVDETEEDED
ncbi:MAG: 50S ribosomal protein L25 [Bacillota bacterium]|nr:50S ribosomal protein L25 [Bacillota bacterium]MDW7678178.1 50S ribosomal protein L25 [Bacillota bacterium]